MGFGTGGARFGRRAAFFCAALALAACIPPEALAAGGLPWAQAPAQALPRGPGFYFQPFKLLLVLAVYLSWLHTCTWVDEDCDEVGLSAELWNPVLLASGLVGLLLVWGIPYFWLSFPVVLALYLSPTLVYVSKRNERVPDARRVLTPRHLRQLANQYLRLGLALDDGPAESAKKAIPIRFLGKSGGRGGDSKGVERVQESSGYRTALEMMYEALQKRATDVHLEPTDDEMTVRFRIDGIMHATTPIDRATGDAILNIFKVLADLDITEKRKPQDGSFSAEVLASPGQPAAKAKKKKDRVEDELDGERDATGKAKRNRQIDFRVATAGSVSGEKMVMRILDRSRQMNSLSRLGMRDKLREQIRSVVTQPHGMFIVCGPTGSGKSTTLYACLSEIDRYTKNVITIENPVEYHIPNVTQIEVNPKAGKTFASELRSILRQDPDVIYVGEVRDKETAEIACQAAQTGHMVFTTLHANDTVTALGRLIDLGVQPFMVANSVSAVLGQRLVRVLCPKCKVKYRPNAELLRKANLPADKIKFFYRPPRRGGDDEEADACADCGNTGYFGRTGLFELLVLTDGIRELLKENPDLDAIRQEAARTGIVYLQEDGMRQVISGETSIQELLRVAK